MHQLRKLHHLACGLMTAAAAGSPSRCCHHSPSERSAPAPLAPLPLHGVLPMGHQHACTSSSSASALCSTGHSRGGTAGLQQLRRCGAAQKCRQACMRAAGLTEHCNAGDGVCKVGCKLSTKMKAAHMLLADHRSSAHLSKTAADVGASRGRVAVIRTSRLCRCGLKKGPGSVGEPGAACCSARCWAACPFLLVEHPAGNNAPVEAERGQQQHLQPSVLPLRGLPGLLGATPVHRQHQPCATQGTAGPEWHDCSNCSDAQLPRCAGKPAWRQHAPSFSGVPSRRGWTR